MKLTRLITENEYIKLIGKKDIEISKAVTSHDGYDSNSLLIILKEENLYREKDFLNCFSAIICEEEVFEKLSSIFSNTLILVENARKIWALVAFRLENIDLSRIKIIGITGTNGKTTTATMIRYILEYAGYKVGFIGTGKISVGDNVLSDENYSMTTPDPPILYSMIKKMQVLGVDYIVMEVSSHSLYYSKVAPLIFELAIFTNISSEHLDFHKNIDEYFDTKKKLLSCSKKAVINIDDTRLRKLAETAEIPVKKAGVIWQGDAFITDIIDNGFQGSNFLYREAAFAFRGKIKTPGKFNIYNSLLAICSTITLGCKPCVVKNAISSFSGIEGRCEIIYDDEITVIIDYAHTEVAFSSILKAIKTYSEGKRISVIFGCGGERYRGKRSVFAKSAEEFADRIYVTSDNSRGEALSNIFSDICAGFSEKCKYELIEKRDEAIKKAVTESQKGEIILLIGKGAERYNIDSSGYHSFDERKIVASAIEERNRGNNESYS